MRSSCICIYLKHNIIFEHAEYCIKFTTPSRFYETTPSCNCFNIFCIFHRLSFHIQRMMFCIMDISTVKLACDHMTNDMHFTFSLLRRFWWKWVCLFKYRLNVACLQMQILLNVVYCNLMQCYIELIKSNKFGCVAQNVEEHFIAQKSFRAS